MATGRLPDPNTAPLTAKGDLYTYSTVPARLAVGSNGDTLVADSSATTGLRWQEPKAGNPVINSAFQVWQRGTSISVSASSSPYTADRWTLAANANQASTVSRQSTGDSTNLPNIQYCARVQRNSGQTGTGGMQFVQTFETANSIPFAGKTVTLSFYARSGANYSPTSGLLNVYGIAGTGTDQSRASGAFTGETYWVNNQNVTLTTTWQRFSLSGTVSSTATQIALYFAMTPTGTAGANDYFEITGVQLEVGSVATPFKTYAATLAGELAACQRYYWRNSGEANYSLLIPSGFMASTTQATTNIMNPVPMRTSAISLDFANVLVQDSSSVNYVPSAASIESATNTRYGVCIAFTVTGGTVGRFVRVLSNNTTAGYIGINAEL